MIIMTIIIITNNMFKNLNLSKAIGSCGLRRFVHFMRGWHGPRLGDDEGC